MVKYLYVFLILLLINNNIIAQKKSTFTLGVESNMQYYIDDDVTGEFKEKNRFRANSYLKADYKIDKFIIGTQLESYAPKALLNYSPNFDKKIFFGLYYAKFLSKKISIDVGHFYEQFGNGIILRSWEDRQLGLNNAIRGVKVVYKPFDNVRIIALNGNHRKGFKVSDGNITGLDFVWDIPNLFSNDNYSAYVGGSYVGRYENENSIKEKSKYWTHAFAGKYGFIINNFYTNAEVVVKTKDYLVENSLIVDNKLFYGNAVQLDFGYSQKGMGINATLRRLENMNFYSDRQATGNTYNELIVNYLPALTKQHDYSLANIYVYQSQPAIQFNPLEKAGEIGGQLDFYYTLKKNSLLGGKYGTKISINTSLWYGLDAEFNKKYKRVDVKSLGFGTQYFSDVSIELRKKINKKLYGIITYIHTNYNKKYVEESKEFVYADILVAESTVKIKKKSSIRIEVSHLWTKQDKQNWTAATLEYNINSHFSVFASDMYNYGNNKEKERNHYYLFGGSFTKGRTRIAINYGRQRGGVLCVGGVCREVPAATGLTFNISSSF